MGIHLAKSLGIPHTFAVQFKSRKFESNLGKKWFLLAMEKITNILAITQGPFLFYGEGGLVEFDGFCSL